MGWKPESERESENDAFGLAIMRREELERLAVAFTMGYLENKTPDAHVKGWDAAIYIQKQLDAVAPIVLSDG